MSLFEIFFVFFIYLLLMNTTEAQKINNRPIPEVLKNAFSNQFPGMKPSWEKESENYEVGFVQNKVSMSAVFNAEGQLLETEIPVSSLPAEIQSYVDIHYKGSVIKVAAIITKPNGENIDEAATKGKDLLFTDKSNFIKENKD
jgi:hypothetical protein